MLMATVQVSGAAFYYSQMEMQTSTGKTDNSLAREFQNNLSDPTQAHCLLCQSNNRKSSSK